MSKARKYFPYGFGAATSSHFLVEDVGEVSEDEEEYDEYQKDWIEDSADGTSTVDIWKMDGYCNFALDGEEREDEEGAEPDEELKETVERKEEEGTMNAWDYEIGPQEKTKFDEYYVV